jgi:hypothetical protein
MKIDPYTYGNDKAAIHLADIIQNLNDKIVTKRVGNFISYYQSVFKETSSIKDRYARELLYGLLKNSILEKLSKEKKFNPSIKSHVASVLTTSLREKLGCKL